MNQLNSKNHTKLKLILSIIALIILLFSINTVSADGGLITKAKYYPEDGGSYESVSYFMEQVAVINSNTTVWVSIDNKSLLQLTYQGLISEYDEPENTVVSWYTWKTEVTPIVSPGIHTFQFFKQYKVWQDEDQYWADFYAYSEEKTFTVFEISQTTEHLFNQTESNNSIELQIPKISGSSEIFENQIYDYSGIEGCSVVLPSAAIIMISFILLILFLKKITKI